MNPSVEQPITGWGRYPVAKSRVYRPERRAAVATILRDPDETNLIARGLGRSYGDPAINHDGGVVNMTRLDRMIAFDPATAMLEAEAGVSLTDIIETFLPRGYFPLVTPGTKFITIGGAIASDVHGKSHHVDGSFINTVESFELLLVDGTIVTCSRTENTDLFWATAGGMGLTGVILSARIRLRPVESSYFICDYLRTRDLDHTLSEFEANDARYNCSMCWIDCLATGKTLGRSVLMRGDHARRDQLPASLAANPQPILHREKARVPIDAPEFALTSLTVRAFNEAYYRLNATSLGKVVNYDTFFYPLDAIHDWHRIYGKRGFIQYQTVFPPHTARAGLTFLLEKISASGRASFLAVLKSFGVGNEAPLSFPFKGYTLALDIPNSPGLVEFLQKLDESVLAHEGRTYLAKDAVLTPEVFAAMYPRANEFRAIKHRVDPNSRLASSLSRRVGLTP